MIAALLAPLGVVATAWLPVVGGAVVPSLGSMDAASGDSPSWTHGRGRAWLVDTAGPDADHHTMWWIRAAPAPSGLAGATGDPVTPAPWWSRLRQPPTDADLQGRIVFEAAWGWPVPVLSMSVRATPRRTTDWAGATDSRTFGTPPATVHVLPTRPIWRGIAISGVLNWLILWGLGLVVVRMAILAVAGRRGLRRRRGACAACGHQLPPAAALARCPECGAAIPSSPASASTPAPTATGR